MKNKFLIASILLFAHVDFSNAQSIETLMQAGKVDAKFTSLGGHSGDCIELSMQNATNDTLQVLIEPGRRLQAADSTDQDILLVKEYRIRLLPKAKMLHKLYGFCCQLHDHSPSKGNAFSVGKMAQSGLLALSRFLASKKIDDNNMQQAIWAISDSISVSGIQRGGTAENAELLKLVCEIRNVPVPWFTTNYGSINGSNLLGTPEWVLGDLHYNLSENTTITVIVRDWNGIVVQTLAEDIPKNPGKQVYNAQINVVNLKPGKYTIYILSDGTNILFSRSFNL